MLVLDDFGIKYVNKQDAEHLLNAPKDHSKVEIDWTHRLYCGITLEWNYKERYDESPYQDTSKSNYKKPPQDSPYQGHSKKYGKVFQDLIPEDATKELFKDKKKSNMLQVVGSILYYVDITLLMALSTIARTQSNNFLITAQCTQTQQLNTKI
ncbi:hypothetical protein ACHAXS_003694 [Conticribra weissflogii]